MAQPGQQQRVGGIVFAYRAIGDYGSFADGLGHVYNFGRSSREQFIDVAAIGDEEKQKEILTKYGRRNGLNRPARVLLWTYTPNLEEMWERMVDNVRGNVWRSRHAGASTDQHPICTQQCMLGDHWYTVENLGPEDFGEWIQEVEVIERREMQEAAERRASRNHLPRSLSDFEIHIGVRREGEEGAELQML